MITCPVCGATAEPAATVGPITLCGACGFTLHVDAAGTVRRAALRDIEALTDAQVRELRTMRAPMVRRKR